MDAQLIVKKVLENIPSDQDFYPSDIEGLVKHTLRKLGQPPSLVWDTQLAEIVEQVERHLSKRRESSLSKEAWVGELGE